MRRKDAYYFPHDSNAKDDPKCIELIDQLGLEGYGVYWVCVETLRDQPNYSYPVKLIPALARRYNTSKEKMGAVINNYGLFEITEDEFFLSPSLCRRMGDVNKHRINGIRGSLIKNNRITKEQSSSLSDDEIMKIHSECRGLAGGLQPASKGLLALKESKEEGKGKNNNEGKPYPSLEQIKEYAQEKEFSDLDYKAESFYDSMQANGWTLKGGKKVKDWKAHFSNYNRKGYLDRKNGAIPSPENPIPND